jgi:hypothetical protein
LLLSALIIGIPAAWTDSAYGPVQSGQVLLPRPLRQPLSACGPLAPPAPYDQHFNRFNASGFLDVRMVIDSLLLSLTELERIMDDLQARTEQLRCEAANTRILLSGAPSAAQPCALAPPVPYARPLGGWLSDGYIDVTLLISLSHYSGGRALEILNDMQARLERIRCDQDAIVRAGASWVAQSGLAQIHATQHPAGPCAKPVAAPSYVRSYIHMNASGVMDYLFAINFITQYQDDLELWMDDLQSRIEQIRCLEASAGLQVSALIFARNAEQRITQVRKGSPLPEWVTSEPESHRLQRGPVDARSLIARQPPADLAAQESRTTGSVPPAPSTVQPTGRNCATIGPAPSYQQPVRHWRCGTQGDCGVYDFFTMNLIADLRRDTEQAADDLQVRIARAVCEQRNLNDAAAYFLALARE